MSKGIYTHLNLLGNELQNAVAQNLSTPPAVPKEGQFYYDTNNETMMIYRNAGWSKLALDEEVLKIIGDQDVEGIKDFLNGFKVNSKLIEDIVTGLADNNILTTKGYVDLIKNYRLASEYWVSSSDGDDTNGNGSRTNPWKTISNPSFLAIATNSSHKVVNIVSAITESITATNWQNITFTGFGVKDSQQTQWTGNHIFTGSSSTRIRFFDIITKPETDDEYIITFNGTSGRHYGDNCTVLVGTTKKAIKYTGNEQRWHEWYDSFLDGIVTNESTNASMSIKFSRQLSQNFNLQMNTFCEVKIRGTQRLDQITHSAGKLDIEGIDEFWRTADNQGIISTATALSGSFLKIRNSNLKNQALDYLLINKTGDCPYYLSNVIRDVENDILIGTQIYEENSIDISANHTAINYNAVNDSINAHIAGIDNVLGSQQSIIADPTNGNIVITNEDGQVVDSGKKFSTDGTFTDNSDNNIATEKAIKTYIASQILAVSTLQGSWDASGNDYPTTRGDGISDIKAGDYWIISVAGTLDSKNVEVGDFLYSFIDNPGQTHSNWFDVEKNIGYAPENADNKVSSWSSTVNDTNYPTEKLVKDTIDNYKNSRHYNSTFQSTDFVNGILTIETATHGLGEGVYKSVVVRDSAHAEVITDIQYNTNGDVEIIVNLGQEFQGSYSILKLD
jgi:hypothetical protein